MSSWETKSLPNSDLINRLDYDYTTLTHRLYLFAAGLTTQKRPASPPLNPVDSPQSKRLSRGVPATTPQTDSFIAQSSDTPPPYYGYRSGDWKIYSVNQDTGVVEIGTSKCMDDASQSTNLDSTYGSRNGTILSSSYPPAPMMSSSIPPKFDRDDSAIELSSNASVLIGSPAKQSQSGRAVQDFGNPIPTPYFYPPSLDPHLPSNVFTQDEKLRLGLESEGLLNRDLHGYLDDLDQKSKWSPLERKHKDDLVTIVNMYRAAWTQSVWISSLLLPNVSMKTRMRQHETAWVLCLWNVSHVKTLAISRVWEVG